MDLTQLELIKQGAEAKIYSGSFLGREAIFKERFSKKYRHPDLDVHLTKERMRAEARAIVKCQSIGVPVPTLYMCDAETNLLVMERVANSITAREYVDQRIPHRKEEKVAGQLNMLATSIGALIARIHAAGLIHGDLTTSNILVLNNAQDDSEDKIDLVLIDFGLSFQEGTPEDKGVDLYVLERAFISSHPNTESVFAAILTSYLQSTAKQVSDEIVRKFEEIRLRGRKRTMVG